MRASPHGAFGLQVTSGSRVVNVGLVVTGTDFLLSMVESRWAGRNGGSRKMDLQLKARQELEKIEQQLSRLQSAMLPASEEILAMHFRPPFSSSTLWIADFTLIDRVKIRPKMVLIVRSSANLIIYLQQYGE